MNPFLPNFFLFQFFFQSDISCELFIWDNEVDELLSNTRNKEMFTGAYMECNNCEVILGYFKEFGNDFGKEFGKEYGKESSSKNVEKLKKLLQIERNETFWLMVALIVSWMLLVIVLKLN